LDEEEDVSKRRNGGCDITVNKRTGKVGYFSPNMDLDLFDRRKPLPVEQFDEYNIAV